jgi:Domain of Unknown Function (DUF1259)
LKGVSNQAEGTFKISKPRNDVASTVEQVRMAPFMGLTSWATFTPGHEGSGHGHGGYGSLRGWSKPGHERGAQ